MPFRTIELELHADQGLAYVTLNRPERRNALSHEVLGELIDCFSDLGKSKTARVLILRAKGPAFSAGHDLSEMKGREAGFYQELFTTCSKLMMLLQSIPQPVIAEVRGMATAAGCQLVASCDLVVAAEEARFATPGVKIGLFCSTPMVALSRAVGQKKAMEMLLTGEPLSALQAQAAGLVNRVVPAAQLEEETRALALRIASSSAAVVGLGKRAFYRQAELPLPEAYAYAGEVMSGNAQNADAQEGMSAFLEKRAPVWKDH